MDLQQLMQWLTEQERAANAMAAIASASMALLALVVSIISLAATFYAAYLQHRHNRLSVTPIPEITVADFENCLRVKLRNHGSGPLLIKSLRVSGYMGNYEKLVDALPVLPGRDWTNFSGKVDGRALLPGSEIVLLELKEIDGEIGFSSSRDLARKALAMADISVEYSDIYGSQFTVYVTSLEWFGRHWATT